MSVVSECAGLAFHDVQECHNVHFFFEFQSFYSSKNFMKKIISAWVCAMCPNTMLE